MNKLCLVMLMSAGAAFATRADAVVTTLTFEGAANVVPMLNYFNDGLDALGNQGPNLGASFNAGAYGVVDQAAGGSAIFTNAPSGHTAMANLESETYVNYAYGFTDGFSFYYSSSVETEAYIFSGVDMTGDLLAAVLIHPQYHDGCASDMNDTFCTWTAAGATFVGTAKSVMFGFKPNTTLFDNMTFGSAIPTIGDGAVSETPSGVPEPASWSLMLAGFGGAGWMLRRSRRRNPMAFA